jgi:hypothetical protein
LIDLNAVREILATYAKHGWTLSRVLLSKETLAQTGDATEIFRDAPIDASDLDAAWFYRRQPSQKPKRAKSKPSASASEIGNPERQLNASMRRSDAAGQNDASSDQVPASYATAWELRYLGPFPYALVTVVQEDGELERELQRIEAEMRQAVSRRSSAENGRLRDRVGNKA